MDRKDCYQKILDKWGSETQSDMCIEEMAELTKALCKLKRVNISGYDKQPILENIKEEIADVLNMAEQLELVFGHDEIEKIRDEKLLRTMKRLADR